MKGIVPLLLIFLLVSMVDAQLVVEKYANKMVVKTGDSIVIGLRIKNNFDKDIKVRIKDKNIIGGSGLDIQCLEQIVKANDEARIEYDPITPTIAGSYTTDKAEITYINPLSGKEEKVYSNQLKIDVKGSGIGGARTITVLYNCNNQYIRQTSSTYGSSNIMISIGGNIQISQNQRSKTVGTDQDMNAIKKEMEIQKRIAERLRNEFIENLLRNEEIKRLDEEIKRLGYNLTDIDIDAENNTTGKFVIEYKRDDDHAKISGEMVNGRIKSLNKITEEDKQNALAILYNNKIFQSYDKDLREEGLKQGNPKIGINYSHKIARIRIPYYRGNKTVAEIYAKIVNNTVKEIRIERNKKELLWIFILPVVLLLVIASIFIFYKKLRGTIEKIRRMFRYFKKEEAAYQAVRRIKKDYKNVCESLLAEAKELFDKGEVKQSFIKLSSAIRIYYANKLDLKKNITSRELINELSKRRYLNKELRNCIEICDLVEFAKYIATEKEFYMVFNVFRKAITS